MHWADDARTEPTRLQLHTRLSVVRGHDLLRGAAVLVAEEEAAAMMLRAQRIVVLLRRRAPSGIRHRAPEARSPHRGAGERAS